MSVDDKCLVVDAEVCLPHYLDLDLPKLLPHGSSGVVEIVVHIFDVDDHEFAHPFSSESGFEAILPVRRFVNFESLHSLDVDDMDESAFGKITKSSRQIGASSTLNVYL